MVAKQRNDLLPAVLAIAVLLIGFHSASRSAEPNQQNLPKPEDSSLRAKDGVRIQVTYYGSNRGKEAVPVILLHDYKGTRNEFGHLAKKLQSDFGHAVLTVDLRGHGGSIRQIGRNRKTVDLDASKFRPPDFLSMIGVDMEAVRKFLVRENDVGKLNLNKLCLVGVGMGATVAVNWAATDWNIPSVPSGKQGQDVKALVLISPRSVYKGVKITQALKQPDIQRKVAVLIVYGTQDRRATKDAIGIHKRWLPFHPEPPASEGIEKQELFLFDFDTNSEGLKKQLFEGGFDNMISQFIDFRLVKQEFEWSRHRVGG